MDNSGKCTWTASKTKTADGKTIYDTGCNRFFDLRPLESAKYHYCPNCGRSINWELKNA